MRNILDKFSERIKTHILHSITFFPEIHAGYEIMWKNMIDPDRPQTAINCGTEKMRLTCGVINL